MINKELTGGPNSVYSIGESRGEFIDQMLKDASRLSPHVIRIFTTRQEVPDEATKIVHDFMRTNPYSLHTNSKIDSYLDDLRDTNMGTYLHSIRVGWYALECGKALGLNEEACRRLMLCGFLHDIGKMGTPKSIIQKRGKLDDGENALMKDHPGNSRRYLSILHDFPEDLALALGAHHEKLNGSGYPEGLKGNQIPLVSRVLAIADIYDAITSNRPYKDACTPDECLSIMVGMVNRGELDEDIFKTFSDNLSLILVGTNNEVIGTVLRTVNIRIIGVDPKTQCPICQILTHDSDFKSHDIRKL